MPLESAIRKTYVVHGSACLEDMKGGMEHPICFSVQCFEYRFVKFLKKNNKYINWHIQLKRFFFF